MWSRHLAFSMRLVVASWVVACAVIGCDFVRRRDWRERVGWRAENFFTDPKVIELCHAIDANDLDEIDRLIAAGADVNARGKDNMTPILWAFPDGKIERFAKLLEHGADPNVIIESDLGVPGIELWGSSVTHLSASTTLPGYFEAVFDHGGDPNLPMQVPRSGRGDTPLLHLLSEPVPNKLYKVRRLMQKGADIHYFSPVSGGAALRVALKADVDVDVLWELLNAGADYSAYIEANSNRKIAHLVDIRVEDNRRLTPALVDSDARFVKWLKDRGESVEQAHHDHERWNEWRKANALSKTPGAPSMMREEVMARKIREPRPDPDEYFDDAKLSCLSRNWNSRAVGLA